jgi:hypothetical protein
VNAYYQSNFCSIRPDPSDRMLYLAYQALCGLMLPL